MHPSVCVEDIDDADEPEADMLPVLRFVWVFVWVK